MDEVTVDLRDGFFDDVVVVSAGGRELVHAQGVKTRMQIGLARSFQLAVPVGIDTLVVDVPTRGSRAEVALPSKRPIWIWISLGEGGELQVEVHAEKPPHGYA